MEERYVELAQPAEFDGIRTQIAQELQIPKKAVKKIIKDFRVQIHVPSWWEIQTYKGSNEELSQIKEVYEPYLPVPAIGIHKIIAEKLSIKPSVAYQAIKTIRQELNLPQYNDPSLHEDEIQQIRARLASTAEAEAETTTAEPETSGEETSGEQVAAISETTAISSEQ